jgi:Na+-transporting methylmalonyl-CoA/oxaloacetate decarboxylase gamma subunit
MYATRFWQLPFAYLGLVGVALALVVKENLKDIRPVAAVFFFLGILVLWIMAGTYKAIDRSVEQLLKVEEALHLPKTAKRYRLIIDLPNFLMVLAVAFICLYLWLWA